MKRKICKRCKTPLVPGITLSVRIRNGRIIHRCLVCGYVKRYPISKKYKNRNTK